MANIERIESRQRLSKATKTGGLVFLSGDVASDPSGDIQDQTRQVLKIIEDRLARCGSSKAHILYSQVWLSDISNFDKMNEVWDAWVPAGHSPARATVEAKLARPEYLIEVMAIATTI